MPPLPDAIEAEERLGDTCDRSLYRHCLQARRQYVFGATKHLLYKHAKRNRSEQSLAIKAQLLLKKYISVETTLFQHLHSTAAPVSVVCTVTTSGSHCYRCEGSTRNRAQTHVPHVNFGLRLFNPNALGVRHKRVTTTTTGTT